MPVYIRCVYVISMFFFGFACARMCEGMYELMCVCRPKFTIDDEDDEEDANGNKIRGAGGAVAAVTSALTTGDDQEVELVQRKVD